jgi:hypothetical protein
MGKSLAAWKEFFLADLGVLGVLAVNAASQITAKAQRTPRKRQANFLVAAMPRREPPCLRGEGAAPRN